MMFDKAIDYLLKNEGGYVNDPLDSGGETNFGISSKFLKSHPENPLCLINPKDITIDIAKKLYQQYFWEPFYFEKLLDELLIIKVFDFGVNVGPRTALMKLQLAHNDICGDDEAARYKHLKIDGILGPISIKSINNFDKGVILNSFINQIILYYKRISEHNQVVKKDLDGLISRARRLP